MRALLTGHCNLEGMSIQEFNRLDETGEIDLCPYVNMCNLSKINICYDYKNCQTYKYFKRNRFLLKNE